MVAHKYPLSAAFTHPFIAAILVRLSGVNEAKLSFPLYNLFVFKESKISGKWLKDNTHHGQRIVDE